MVICIRWPTTTEIKSRMLLLAGWSRSIGCTFLILSTVLGVIKGYHLRQMTSPPWPKLLVKWEKQHLSIRLLTSSNEIRQVKHSVFAYGYALHKCYLMVFYPFYSKEYWSLRGGWVICLKSGRRQVAEMGFASRSGAALLPSKPARLFRWGKPILGSLLSSRHLNNSQLFSPGVWMKLGMQKVWKMQREWGG